MTDTMQTSESPPLDFETLLQARPNFAQLGVPPDVFMPCFDAYLTEKCRLEGTSPDAVNLAEMSSAGLLATMRWMRKYRYLGRGGHTVNIHNFLLHFPASGCTLLWIPKNSCTSIKRLLLQFEPEDVRAQILPNRFHETVQKQFKLDMRSFFRDEFGPLTVLIRHPAERLVSCYIDKFVNPVAKQRNFEPFVRPHIQRAQQALGIAPDLQRSLRFSEFVSYVASSPAWRLDAHWRPQADFLGGRMRDGTTLVRSDNFGYFAEVFGFETANSRHNASSGKRFKPGEPVTGEFADMHPSEMDLDAIASYNQFFDADLMDTVNALYLEDKMLFDKAI